MSKPQLEKIKINRIITLRKRGYSLYEIAHEVKCSASTVHRYIDGVVVEGEYLQLLRKKQGRSAYRSACMWDEERGHASNFIGKITKRDIIILLTGLYWGEGTKKELNLINGDPKLVRVFLRGLYALGVYKNDVRINLRVYGKNNMLKTKSFWLSQLDLTIDNLSGYELLPERGSNKLPYGMCRVRVVKSQRFFKRIMSMVHLFGE